MAVIDDISAATRLAWRWARSLLTGALSLAIVSPGLASAETENSAPSAATVTHDLDVALVRGSIWNPGTLTRDAVELRSYRGEGVKDGDFTAPPIRVRPGDRLRLNLANRLAPCTQEELTRGPCRNDTNIHTHGLWVSPVGNSDNVSISVPPGGRFEYDFHIPEDHPAGTFWYHPHRHGSGMFQLGSGMAGALIVEGNRLPTAERPGDIDILLKDTSGRPFPERVLLYQTIPYACAFEADGWPSQARDKDGKRTGPFLCAPGEIGRVERFEQFVIAPKTGDREFIRRNFMLDGQVQPLLRGAKAGKFERWRFIHAGAFSTPRLRFRKLAPGAPDLATVSTVNEKEWIDRYCTGTVGSFWEVARDGLTRSEIRKGEESSASAGNRVDFLTWFPERGRYCLSIRRARPGQADAESILAMVEVGGRAASVPDPAAELRRQLSAAAERALRGPRHAAMRRKVLADLENGLRLDAFMPHRAVADAELTGRQTLYFETVGQEGERDFQVDGRKFDHARVDRYLPLGGVEEWRLSTPANPNNTPHTFHIHVNPFQIVSISNVKGEDVTDPASPGYDVDYSAFSGQWLDTILLKPGTSVVMRTRYRRFTGETMIHCHLVHHSDLGMMQHAIIFAPGGPDDPGAGRRDHQH